MRFRPNLAAAAYARVNDYRQSQNALESAIELEPSNHLSWVLLGDLEARRGNIAAARESYPRALIVQAMEEAGVDDMKDLPDKPRDWFPWLVDEGSSSPPMKWLSHRVAGAPPPPPTTLTTPRYSTLFPTGSRFRR